MSALHPTSIHKILIRAPNWVGDVVMATGNFADVRRAFPRAEISVLLKPGREKILEGSTDVDRFLFDRAGSSLSAQWRLARELRAQKLDLALLFPNSFRAAWIAWLAGIPRRAGYRRNLRSALLTHGVSYEREGSRRKPVPMPIFYARIGEAVGIPRGDLRPRLFVPQECEERAARLRGTLGIGSGERLIGLNPGASFGASKLWPPENFAAVGDALTERLGLRTIIFVGPGEEPIAEAISSRMKHRPIYDPKNLVPLDILKPFVRDLKLMVTTDTGPRHYAVAFRVPTVVVMGPTHPDYTAINLEETEVVRHDVPCGPCHLKTCPIDHKCMVGITPGEVLERVEALELRVSRAGSGAARR